MERRKLESEGRVSIAETENFSRRRDCLKQILYTQGAIGQKTGTLRFRFRGPTLGS